MLFTERRDSFIEGVIRGTSRPRPVHECIAALTNRRVFPALTATANGDKRMGNAAVALALLGFAVGALFRLRILLPILALLLMVSIVFSLACGLTFLDTTLIIVAAQTILQGSYFLGLVIRALLTAAYRMLPVV
jgi:hypothetical protein